MKTEIKKPTLKRFLNKLLRVPQRTNSTRLTTGAITVISVFKNKQIVEVLQNSNYYKFNSKI